MKRAITLLSLLLIVQLGLVLLLQQQTRPYNAEETGQSLLDFDPTAISRIVIEDNEQQLVTLVKHDRQQWRISGHHDFPAANGRVQQLMDTLHSLRGTWPVATTADAAERFRVGENAFERRITLASGDDTVATLLLGSSPGLRKVHARNIEQNDIHAIDFSIHEAPATAAAWEDRQLLHLDATQIDRIELPGLQLQMEGGRMEVALLREGEISNQTKVDELLNQLSHLNYLEVTGTETPLTDTATRLVYKLQLKDETSLAFELAKLTEGDNWALKSSQYPFYFEFSDQDATALQGFNRSALIVEEGGEAVTSE